MVVGAAHYSFEEKRAIQGVFLAAFAETGIVLDGLRAADVPRATVQYWRESDAVFAQEYEEAIETSNDVIRAMIRERASGYQEELHYRGLKTGDTVTKYDPSTLHLLARSRMPKEFRTNAAVELSESAEMADVRERFLDRLAAMSERLQEDDTAPPAELPNG